MKSIKKIAAVGLACSLALVCFAGCSGGASTTGASSASAAASSASASATASASSAVQSSAQATASDDAGYQAIFDEYSEKIDDATPGLVSQFNAEAADKKGDITALAELSNKKVEELAAINAEGMEKMAQLMQKNGDAYSVYEDWAKKLTDVYTDCSKQITDAYMKSAS